MDDVFKWDIEGLLLRTEPRSIDAPSIVSVSMRTSVVLHSDYEKLSQKYDALKSILFDSDVAKMRSELAKLKSEKKDLSECLDAEVSSKICLLEEVNRILSLLKPLTNFKGEDISPVTAIANIEYKLKTLTSELNTLKNSLKFLPVVEGPIRVGTHLGSHYISLDGSHLKEPISKDEKWMNGYANLLRLRRNL